TLEVTPIEGVGGETPIYAIDAYMMGSVYADKITIISTEEGVGVRNQGEYVSRLEDLRLSSEGELEYNRAYSKKILHVSGKGDVIQKEMGYGEEGVHIVSEKGAVVLGGDYIASEGEVKVEGKTGVILGEAESEEKYLIQGQTIVLQSGGIVNITNADVYSGSQLVLDAEGNIGIQKTEMSGEGIEITAGGEVKQEDSVMESQLGDIHLTAGSLKNKGSLILSQENIKLDIGEGGIVNDGEIESGEDIDINSEGHFENEGDVFSEGNMNVVAEALNNEAGIIWSNGTLAVNVEGDLENTDGTIVGNERLDITAGHINNEDTIEVKGLVTGGDLSIEQTNGSPLKNTNGLIYAGGDIEFIGPISLENNGGELIAVKDIQFGGDHNSDITNIGGMIKAGEDIRIKANTLVNDDGGKINAAGTLKIEADEISNQNTKGEDEEGKKDEGLIGGVVELIVGKINNFMGSIISESTLEITETESIDNRFGIIKGIENILISIGKEMIQEESVIEGGKDVTIFAGAIDNTLSTIQSGGRLKIQATEVKNKNGRLFGKGSVDVENLDNEEGEVESEGDIILTNEDKTFNNKNGRIEQTGEEGTIQITGVNEIDNEGGTIAAKDRIEIDFEGDAIIKGKISAENEVAITAEGLENEGDIESGNRLVLTITNALKNRGKLAAKKMLEIISNTVQNFGVVTSEGEIDIDASGKVTNEEEGLITGKTNV
ncbi:MAG: hypothetical protein HRT90_05990, partial [Candidatus Margulisbacteria bacterium]|nr:hypothetical protein [Candidatus Margulisiibacteriota bacterium]